MITDKKIAVTLANSIIGVGIVAMPFCLKQCGLVLGALMLGLSALLTRFSCHLLLKSGQMTRRKTYECIAFHTFGKAGKLVAEFSIIGFMLGILISFFVVMGDLGTPILAHVLGIQMSDSLRTLVLLCLGFGAALPLSMLKEVGSLAGLSTLSFIFYVLIIVKAVIEAFPMLVSHACWDVVSLWKPVGILQSLPIFALALSCQTQIFEVYECLPDPSLKKMNAVVKMAVYLCTAVYFGVGFFGYTAFCTKEISGNILKSFSPGMLTEFTKFCFLLSVAFSFPLIVLPCRASIHSLLFRRHVMPIDAGHSQIPEHRFKVITVTLIVVTLAVGIFCPSIETVLGFVGSTIGVTICIILPAVMFIKVTPKHTFEKYGAQLVFFLGLCLLVSCTWVNLNAYNGREHLQTNSVIVDVRDMMPTVAVRNEVNVNTPENAVVKSTVASTVKYRQPKDTVINEEERAIPIIPIVKEVDLQEQRQEPPVPHMPDTSLEKKALPDKIAKQNDKNDNEIAPDALQREEKELNQDSRESVDEINKEDILANKQEEILKRIEVQQEEQKKILEQQREILEELKAHGKIHDTNSKSDATSSITGSQLSESHNTKMSEIKKNDSPNEQEMLEKKLEKSIIKNQREQNTLKQEQQILTQIKRQLETQKIENDGGITAAPGKVVLQQIQSSSSLDSMQHNATRLNPNPSKVQVEITPKQNVQQELSNKQHVLSESTRRENAKNKEPDAHMKPIQQTLNVQDLPMPPKSSNLNTDKFNGSLLNDNNMVMKKVQPHQSTELNHSLHVVKPTPVMDVGLSHDGKQTPLQIPVIIYQNAFQKQPSASKDNQGTQMVKEKQAASDDGKVVHKFQEVQPSMTSVHTNSKNIPDVQLAHPVEAIETQLGQSGNSSDTFEKTLPQEIQQLKHSANEDKRKEDP